MTSARASPVSRPRLKPTADQLNTVVRLNQKFHNYTSPSPQAVSPPSSLTVVTYWLAVQGTA
eukprot:CAMPEP_0119368056 /NCGR_PEP_ID=MMETSP1334-20130426/14760_1 /TAXON_ID=127549 /ORGANISM="Calcidiscus leptoporus, Strain RCC1130" /LENGTH=61 /DNA_ID=CAMNT_0007384609 /DNA_START=37 /DNA_END=223 /DNA_ORIENTATION=-